MNAEGTNKLQLSRFHDLSVLYVRCCLARGVPTEIAARHGNGEICKQRSRSSQSCSTLLLRYSIETIVLTISYD